jgi:hypothetical protein
MRNSREKRRAIRLAGESIVVDLPRVKRAAADQTIDTPNQMKAEGAELTERRNMEPSSEINAHTALNLAIVIEILAFPAFQC